jgi:hypothetical protein
MPGDRAATRALHHAVSPRWPATRQTDDLLITETTRRALSRELGGWD